ncbi:hypothetical protein [Niabella hibiscisoli]|uniref:hypothetical protein n=1 Tax=Niabella hibiscisoli TaxID=1825928 RepID=UPI001F0FDEC3|nr:hypothetical protein [Niabella hibiscisoli]MCH5716469.1 hypothetical protein [Niabella hibiscisoli]
MKKTMSLLLTCLSVAGVYAQTKPDWENPEVFAINKENTRATSLPYATENQALQNEYKTSPYFKSLNGNWQFCWVAKVADVPANFFEESNYSPITTGPWKKAIPTRSMASQTGL